MSDVYEIGRYYDVPTVYAEYCRVTAYWPVIGEFHQDAEILEFPYWHWHLDARFVDAKSYNHLSRGWMRKLPGRLERALPVMLLPNSSVRITPETKPAVVMKRRKCVRSFVDAPYMDDAVWMADLEAAHARKQLANGHCPHRGADLSTLPIDRHGCVECPLHGLRWHVETGRMVTRKEWREMDCKAAQP